ncbi:ATP-grasp domain-containing protein [Bombilactobacillus bombi]|uniref:ATP-grasp domain-containing protein n=1 Tax=Bombilactobacillus bombi TaxID=1303590 RepID=UPI000E57B9AC|nr:ATP-grasp domain-containing protein [Bombilactobacillus bombi]AXX64473.1 ATP-grasp domain-containing protein [Bombilactobacillus bombi]
MNKKVLIVEPSFYGVSFVKSAKKMGCKVICVVSSLANPKKYGYNGYYDDLILADIRSSSSILKAIGESEYDNFDAIIPATDYAIAVTAKVAQKLKMYGNSYFAAKCARNKDLARKQFLKENVPSANFAVVKTLKEAQEASQLIGYPLILKPTNTASSIDVFYIQNNEELKRKFNQITKLKKSYMDFKVRNEYILEEYLDGPEFSVELFLNNDSIEFAEVTEKHTTEPPYFVELMHIFPTTIEIQHKKEIIETAYQAARSLDFHSGPTHIEVKLTSSGPKIVEVNGRPGGDHITSDLIYDSYGINIFQKTIDLYLNNQVSITPSYNGAAAINFLFSNNSGKFNSIQGINYIKSSPYFKKLEIDAIPGQVISKPTNSDDRIGYYILSGKNGEQLKNEISELNKKIKIIID